MKRRHAPQRPGLTAGVVFATGAWCASCVGDPPQPLIPLAVTCLAAVVLRWLPRVPRMASIWVQIFAAGLIRAGLFAIPPSGEALSCHLSSDGEVVISATVASEPEPRLHETRYILDLHAAQYRDSLRVRTGQLLARFPEDPGFIYGEQVQLRGRWKQAGTSRNPGDFDYARFLKRRGIDALWVPAPQDGVLARTPPEGLSWTRNVVAPARSWIGRRFATHLSGEPLALVFGLLFGEKAGMKRSTVEAFEITGTLHLLAVSGSNVAIVVGVVWGWLTFLRIRGWPRSACCLIAILLFCDLAHDESSVVRASVAAALVIVGRLSGRVPDPLNIWGSSLLLLLMWDPRQLHEVGFQLSYLATLGILLFYPPLHRAWEPRTRWVRPVRALVLAAWVSVAAQLTTLPILAVAFRRVPLVTPVSNLICVPAAGLVTAAGSAAVLAATVSDWLFGVLCAITWLSCNALLWSVHLFAGWSIPVWNPGLSSGLWGIYGAGLLLAYGGLMFPHLRRRVVLGGIALLGFVSWAGVPEERTGPHILIVDCGPRSASLVRWPGGSTWWIAPRRDFLDSRCRRIIRNVVATQKWSMPGQVWLLEDGSPSRADSGSLDELEGGIARPCRAPSWSAGGEEAWTVRAQLAGAGLDLSRLEMTGPGGKLIWLSSGSLLGHLRMANARPSVVLVPDLAALPVGAGPLPASVHVVETGAGLLPRPQASLPPGQILRTQDAGAIEIHCHPGEIRSEASMR